MKETGIIMSGNHPKLILDGIKTMTRRVIKPNLEAKLCKNSDIVRFCNTRYLDAYMFEVWHPVNKNTPLPLMIKCPYGRVGDRLWVRETWKLNEFGLDTPTPAVIYKAGEPRLPIYLDQHESTWFSLKNPENWQSSYFMPRWASRITLEITGVRGERVQEISEEDAKSEGSYLAYDTDDNERDFIYLWDSINAKRGYGWETNLWVWVISFKKI